MAALPLFRTRIMANFEVTVQNDDGTGLIAGTLSKAILDANTTAGDDTIILTTDVNITGVMKRLIDSNINLNGGGYTVSGDADSDGDGDFRPFFIKSGTVVFGNLTIANGLAKGGDSNLGGGGAGMGGGLFVYNGAVTLNDVDFTDNVAQGGNSGISSTSGLTINIGAGGGGLYGNGHTGGYGGGSLFANTPGGAYSTPGAYGGYGNYGGGIGSFGGGGNNGQNGGFGGGGGSGGNGGFGGGGGGESGPDSNPRGGYGGGDAGKGGDGMGGAVFVRSGSLSITGGSFTGNTATGSQGLGGALFVMKSITNANNQGMPTTLPTATLTGVTFSGNSAANNSDLTATPATFDDAADLDTEDIFGINITRRVVPEVFFAATAFVDSESVGTSSVVTLTRSGATTIASTVQVNITSGTATAGTDYTDASFPVTVTFAAGETSKTVDISIIADSLAEGDETITLSLTAPKNATIGSQSTASLTITDSELQSGLLTPQADTTVLEVTRLSNLDTLTFQPNQIGVDSVSEILIFSTDASGNTRTQIGSFSVLVDGELPDSYQPVFSLPSGSLVEGKLLRFEIVENGVTRVATLSTLNDNEALVDFGDGTSLTAVLATSTPITDLLVGDADAIDFTGLTGNITVNFSVYREARFNNTVGFYTTDDVAGTITDPITGNTLRPSDAGYSAAALARQVGPTLTGTNGQLETSSANMTSSQLISMFLVADGGDPATGTVYFSHAGANDGNDYVKQLGNNTFGFEDMPGLGDSDFNDVVVTFAVA